MTLGEEVEITQRAEQLAERAVENGWKKNARPSDGTLRGTRLNRVDREGTTTNEHSNEGRVSPH